MKPNEVEITKPLYAEYKTDNFELYIAPNESIVSVFALNMLSAEKEIHCVLRALNYIPLEYTLKAKEESGVNVRLFINSDYAGNKRIYWPSTKFDDLNRKGMLHSNYCIIDNQIVLTGSLILNMNTINHNLHTFMVINSSELADHFNDNFWQLYNNQTNKTGSEESDFIKINNEIEIKPYFCPYDDCEKLIIDKVEESKQYVGLAIYSFTNENIFGALLEAEERGIKVQGILERRGITFYTVDILKSKGIITENIKRQVHTKAFIFDDKITITGSMNPTFKGVNENDEAILLIKSEKINELYRELINTLYEYSQTEES